MKINQIKRIRSEQRVLFAYAAVLLHRILRNQPLQGPYRCYLKSKKTKPSEFAIKIFSSFFSNPLAKVLILSIIVCVSS